MIEFLIIVIFLILCCIGLRIEYLKEENRLLRTHIDNLEKSNRIHIDNLEKLHKGDKK